MAYNEPEIGFRNPLRQRELYIRVRNPHKERGLWQDARKAVYRGKITNIDENLEIVFLYRNYIQIDITLIQDFQWIVADNIMNPNSVMPIRKLDSNPFCIDVYTEDYRGDDS